MAEQKQVKVNLSPSVYEGLVRLAATRGTTMADVLRDAIALEKWYVDTTEEGSRVVVERPNGEKREVLFR